MTIKTQLRIAPPYAVAQSLKQLGQNLRVARLRRNLTIEEVAEKIGSGVRQVRDAEGGKASTGIAAYAALLWVYGLLEPFDDLADPARDEEGLALAARKEKVRARKGGGLDNDF